MARRVDETSSSETLRDRVLERIREIDQYIEETASKYGVRADLVRRMIRVESGGDPHARGKAGEVGLMQLMPDTARQLGVKNPDDPKANIDGSTSVWCWLVLFVYGSTLISWTLALPAPNADAPKLASPMTTTGHPAAATR